MKTIFFTPKFHPDPNYYINDVVFDINLHEKIVITGKTEGESIFKFVKYVENTKIYLIPYFRRPNNSLFSLFLEYLTFFISSFIFTPIILFIEKPQSIVHYGISPPLYGLPIIFLKPFLKYKYIFWLQDIWPESVFTRIRGNKLIYSTLELIMSFFYKCSDVIPSNVAILNEPRFYPYKKKLVFLPQGYKRSLKNKSISSQADKIIEAIKNESRKVIIYAGNISNSMFLDEFSDGVESFKDELCFYIVGDGSLKKQISNKKLSGTYIFEFVPRNEIVEVIGEADFAYIGRETNLQTEIVSKVIPSKFALYCLAKTPIISLSSGYLNAFIKKSMVGISSSSVKKEDISNLLKESLVLDNDNVDSMKRNQESIYSEMFDHEKVLKKIKELIIS